MNDEHAPEIKISEIVEDDFEQVKENINIDEIYNFKLYHFH